MLGTLLICAAVVLVTGAVRAKDRLMIALAATGLVAVIGAFAAGELFVRDGRDGVSLSMALLTGVALVSYASALARAEGIVRLTRDDRVHGRPSRQAEPTVT